MGNSRVFAIRYLKAIEKKNQDYFTENNLHILDCVEIMGTDVVSVHIKYLMLPYAIIEEIETMFWAE